MRQRALIPILLLALSGCGTGATNAAPDAAAANAPVIRLPAVPGRPASGYFELRISGDRGALVGVTSPQFARVEMHETMSHGTMTSMRPLARIPVRDGELLSFRPGGRHLMLFDLTPGTAAGSPVTLTLQFERGAPETITAPLVAVGGDIP